MSVPFLRMPLDCGTVVAAACDVAGKSESRDMMKFSMTDSSHYLTSKKPPTESAEAVLQRFRMPAP